MRIRTSQLLSSFPVSPNFLDLSRSTFFQAPPNFNSLDYIFSASSAQGKLNFFLLSSTLSFSVYIFLLRSSLFSRKLLRTFQLGLVSARSATGFLGSLARGGSEEGAGLEAGRVQGSTGFQVLVFFFVLAIISKAKLESNLIICLRMKKLGLINKVKPNQFLKFFAGPLQPMHSQTQTQTSLHQETLENDMVDQLRAMNLAFVDKQKEWSDKQESFKNQMSEKNLQIQKYKLQLSELMKQKARHQKMQRIVQSDQKTPQLINFIQIIQPVEKSFHPQFQRLNKQNAELRKKLQKALNQKKRFELKKRELACLESKLILSHMQQLSNLNKKLSEQQNQNWLLKECNQRCLIQIQKLQTFREQSKNKSLIISNLLKDMQGLKGNCRVLQSRQSQLQNSVVQLRQIIKELKRQEEQLACQLEAKQVQLLQGKTKCLQLKKEMHKYLQQNDKMKQLHLQQSNNLSQLQKKHRQLAIENKRLSQLNIDRELELSDQIGSLKSMVESLKLQLEILREKHAKLNQIGKTETAGESKGSLQQGQLHRQLNLLLKRKGCRRRGMSVKETIVQIESRMKDSSKSLTIIK